MTTNGLHAGGSPGIEMELVTRPPPKFLPTVLDIGAQSSSHNILFKNEVTQTPMTLCAYTIELPINIHSHMHTYRYTDTQTHTHTHTHMHTCTHTHTCTHAHTHTHTHLHTHTHTHTHTHKQATHVVVQQSKTEDTQIHLPLDSTHIPIIATCSGGLQRTGLVASTIGSFISSEEGSNS